MYNDSLTFRKTMGDVDVLWHDGLFHLFHLVLPNHDFIAHAVSKDGFDWKRVDNALFIGHPGGWDDHMLWTMHVSPDPHNPGQWRMFFTGLSRRDHGEVQRIGMARSSDLYVWKKVPDNWQAEHVGRHDGSEGVSSGFDANSPFPLAAQPPHYEHSRDQGRSWISWRDPFYYREDGRGFLLASGRVADGPIIRRGCVALYEEVAPDRFELRPPLHRPGQYDDIEVPNLLKLGGYYYLLGSIREDAKVRYWYTDSLDKPWRNFYDNVLLAQGNYAARISHDPHGPLLWNFFSIGSESRSHENIMPPPKRLVAREDGQLRVVPFEGFEKRTKSVCLAHSLLPLMPLVDNVYARWCCEDPVESITIESEGGFEGFLFNQQVDCFRFSATLSLEGTGKCGLVFRADRDSSNGYYLSLDLLKGVAQLRAWGQRPGGKNEHAFDFRALQSAYWRTDCETECQVSLLALRNYIEFSLNGSVMLTLADSTFASGGMGCYVETARLRIDRPMLEHLQTTQDSTETLATG
jgi:beta-fructofuranosidase